MLGTSLLWRSTVAFTYSKVKSANCLCLLPVVLVLVLRIWVLFTSLVQNIWRLMIRWRERERERDEEWLRATSNIIAMKNLSRMPRLLIRMRLARNDKSNMVIATVDMQSVLQIPCSEESTLYSLYYSRGSSEIGTSLYKWLTRLPDSVGEVIIYSDTCGGQNRNRHMAALLLYAVQMT